MLHFKIGVLNTAQVDSDALAAWEIAACFLKAASIGDLEIDIKEATEWYIDNIVDEADRESYRVELQMAEGEMYESFSSGLKQLAEERIASLGSIYPFNLTRQGQLERKNQPLSAISICYLSLQFYRALVRGHLEIEGKNNTEIRKQKGKFNDAFAKVFELIAAFAVQGHTSGTLHMISHCRSPKKLEALLKLFCKKVGIGEVLAVDNWKTQYQYANDGGVDCIVHEGGPGMPGHASLLLVGASIQESNIDSKIMTRDKLRNFEDFFQVKPGPFRGVLVRPQDHKNLVRHKCNAQDCQLYSYDEVWKGLSKLAIAGKIPPTGSQLNVRATRVVEPFKDTIMSHSASYHSC